MRLKSTAVLKVCGRPEPREINGKNYYSLAIFQDGEAGNVNCSEDAYNMVGPVGDGFVSVRAELIYNDKYKSFSVARIILGDIPAPTPKSPK